MHTGGEGIVPLSTARMEIVKDLSTEMPGLTEPMSKPLFTSFGDLMRLERGGNQGQQGISRKINCELHTVPPGDDGRRVRLEDKHREASKWCQDEFLQL